MTNLKSLLDETIESWEDTRNGLIEEIEVIPANRFDFRPAEGARSAGELAVHVMEVGMMMVGELTRDDTNLHRAPWPKLLEMYAKPVSSLKTKREIVSALRRTLRDGMKRFAEVGELHMLQTIVRFDGNRGTRLAWFQHGVAHEMYHRGQVALYARILGIKPALTRRIEGS